MCPNPSQLTSGSHFPSWSSVDSNNDLGQAFKVVGGRIHLEAATYQISEMIVAMVMITTNPREYPSDKVELSVWVVELN